MMRRLLPWLFGAWSVLLSTGWLLSWINYPDAILPLGLPAALTLAVGSFLTLKVPRNLIGPLLCVGASAALIYDIGTAYAVYSVAGDSTLPGEHMAAWLGTWTLPLFFLCLPILLVSFPDGRFSGGRRWFLPIFAVPMVFLLVGALRLRGFPTETLVDEVVLDGLPEYEILNPAFVLSWSLMFPATGSLLVRYRRSASTEKQQIRWLLAAGLLVPPIAWVLIQGLGIDAGLVLAIAPCAAPAAIGVAVTRYHLYDLGRVVSRTVSYTIVIGILAAVFAAGVVWIPSLLGLGDSPLAVAVSTLVVAALFNPVRKRVQTWADRRFNRSRFDAEGVMDEFAKRIRDDVDAESLVDGWIEVVTETMQPEAVGVWVDR